MGVSRAVDVTSQQSGFVDLLNKKITCGAAGARMPLIMKGNYFVLFFPAVLFGPPKYSAHNEVKIDVVI